jgi:hypothetical protein
LVIWRTWERETVLVVGNRSVCHFGIHAIIDRHQFAHTNFYPTIPLVIP